jgi:hypothetical protein
MRRKKNQRQGMTTGRQWGDDIEEGKMKKAQEMSLTSLRP